MFSTFIIGTSYIIDDCTWTELKENNYNALAWETAKKSLEDIGYLYHAFMQLKGNVSHSSRYA